MKSLGRQLMRIVCALNYSLQELGAAFRQGVVLIPLGLSYGRVTTPWNACCWPVSTVGCSDLDNFMSHIVP